VKTPEPFKPAKLSVVIACFNEEQTLATCVDRVLAIQGEGLCVEIIVVDDCSRDRSAAIAEDLVRQHPEVRLLRHAKNQGKGAALRTGFHEATGDFVAVQDADLEYEPMDLTDLLGPLRSGKADVVFGSRFLGATPHRVLYFWHYLGNLFLTFLSNMFTDLNLSDMETCYKVFRRQVIQSIEIKENRFGFEPEVVAKVAQQRLRIYEMGISYSGRTYAEGKKIGWRDGVRALYCIFRYNAHQLPLPMQFLIYLLIGGTAAVINLITFVALMAAGVVLSSAAPIAFIVAAALNYLLCVNLLFYRKVRWNAFLELVFYAVVVVVAGGLDLAMTSLLHGTGMSPWLAKSVASSVGLIFNFVGRRFWVFSPKRP